MRSLWLTLAVGLVAAAAWFTWHRSSDVEPRASVPGPLPIGMWQVHDADEAVARLRPHWDAFPEPVRRDYEASVRDVMEFRENGSVVGRSGSGARTVGTWRRDADRILADVRLAGPTFSGVHPHPPSQTVEFLVKADALFVVSFGEQIELVRSLALEHVDERSLARER